MQLQQSPEAMLKTCSWGVAMFERPSQRMSAAVGTNPSCIAQESPLLMCSLQTHLFQDSVSPLDLYIEWESHASNEKTRPSNEKEKDTCIEWERSLYIGPLLIENILARRTFIFFFFRHQHQEQHMHYLRTTGQRQDSGISSTFRCLAYSSKMITMSRFSSSAVKE